MKSINFIHSIPPKTRSALYRWMFVSVVALLATCSMLLVLYMRTHYQYQTLWATCQKLHGSKDRMFSFLQDKRLTKEQELLFKEKLHKITASHEKQKKITTLIELLAQPTSASVTLQNLELKKKLATLTLRAASSENIFAYITHLEQQTLFASVSLQSVEAHDDYVQAIVHALLA